MFDLPSLLSLLFLLSLLPGILHFFFALPKLRDLSAGQSPKSEASKVVAWLFPRFHLRGKKTGIDSFAGKQG